MGGADMIWDELTTTDVAALPRKTPVLLPLAATEQHGPHLPLATDRIIAEHFARVLHERMGSRVLVLPALAVGCSDHHMDFAGTLTLTHNSFARAASDILASVAAHGFRNLVLFNAHGGNNGITQVILERFGRHYSDCHVVATTWWRLAARELLALNESGPGGVGHAGEFETSLLLHIAPTLVRHDAIATGGNRPTFPWAEGDMLRTPPASLYRDFKQQTDNGVYGHPPAASAEKGQAIERAVLKSLEEIVRSLEQAEPPTTSPSHAG